MPQQNDPWSTPPSDVGNTLQQRFGRLNHPQRPELLRGPDAKALLTELCDALESGTLRTVQGDGMGKWWVNPWIRRALMLLSGAGALAEQPGILPGSEVDTLGWSQARPLDRRIPAGSFIRRGAHIAPGVTIMPPSTVQAGAAILERAVIDSHVLVGTGVLVGEETVVGCGTMLAGALGPDEALPVVLERGVAIGGNCGLYGSIVVGERVSIFAGTVIRSNSGLFHAQRREWLMPDASGMLRIPNGATISMGVPPAEAFLDGIQRPAPLIAD